MLKSCSISWAFQRLLTTSIERMALACEVGVRKRVRRPELQGGGLRTLVRALLLTLQLRNNAYKQRELSVDTHVGIGVKSRSRLVGKLSHAGCFEAGECLHGQH